MIHPRVTVLAERQMTARAITGRAVRDPAAREPLPRTAARLADRRAPGTTWKPNWPTW
jgi:hypothetical protein